MKRHEMKDEDSQIKFTYKAYRDMQRVVYRIKNCGIFFLLR